MTKKEMEERIKKLEAQVERLWNSMYPMDNPRPVIWPGLPITCDPCFTQPFRKLDFKTD
jgi:tetrahydromethanopterin S-methyltransferase subunit B